LSEGSGIAEVPTFNGFDWILEDCHGCEHAEEAQLLVEALLAWYRVQDDLLVAGGKGNKTPYNFLSQSEALMPRQHGYVAYV
jgi:hypothetical protein